MPESNSIFAFRIWRLLGVAALLLAAVPSEAHELLQGASSQCGLTLAGSGGAIQGYASCYNDTGAPAGTGGASNPTHIGNRCVSHVDFSLGTADRTKGRFGGLNVTYRASMGHLTTAHRQWTNGNGEVMHLHVCP